VDTALSPAALSLCNRSRQ